MRKRRFDNGEVGVSPAMAHPQYKKMAQDIIRSKKNYAEGGEVKQDKWFSGDDDEAAAKREAWKERWASMSKGVSGRGSEQKGEGILDKAKHALGFADGGMVEGDDAIDDDWAGEEQFMADDTSLDSDPPKSGASLEQIMRRIRMRHMNKGGAC